MENTNVRKTYLAVAIEEKTISDKPVRDSLSNIRKNRNTYRFRMILGGVLGVVDIVLYASKTITSILTSGVVLAASCFIVGVSCIQKYNLERSYIKTINKSK